jgi:ABC-type Fe3+-hydroxamate transport system substrate-binding protein
VPDETVFDRREQAERSCGRVVRTRTNPAAATAVVLRGQGVFAYLSPMMRIVSLCPSLTELVFDLGRGDDLVGRTKFCVHPAGRVEQVEMVGGTKNPKLGRIVALAPDLVLMNEEENRHEDAEALRAAGLRIHPSMPRDALETAAMVRSIGRALDAPDAAEPIAADIEVRSRRVRAEVAARVARGVPPVRWAYLIWRGPYMAVSGDTFVSALLTQAGGENVFAAHPDRYPVVSPEEIRAADPALVLLSTEPFPFKEAHADELATGTGIPRERFRIADGELLSWHGSRTPAGVDYADAVIRAATPA